MTHQQLLRENSRPAELADARCRGEMQLSAMFREKNHGLIGEAIQLTTEMWVCEECNFTIVIKVIDIHSRRITAGFPPATIPFRLKEAASS